MTELADTFEANRPRMFAVAYRMLSSVTEAEDAVQEAWLRWSAADRSSITNPTAWLTTVVSRIAIDRLRSAQKRRETYVGPWLPEPIVDDSADDPAIHAELADSLSLAFLSLLERLNPVERAAFLLREVFSEEYAEIAKVIDRSEVACRQIVHRAKDRIGPDRPIRYETSAANERQLIDTFLAAALMGDLDALHEVLAEDVVVWSDGGADRHAARRPVVGRHRVALFATGIARRGEMVSDDVVIHPVRVNGGAGVASFVDGALYFVIAFDLGPNGIEGIRVMLNPAKLTHLQQQAADWLPAP
ncbi:MAG: RNA polymerase sigma-70 factor (TIGR02957 family) [Candidatus Aldehydirespiratoraceae bacterium]|jgi:RNA polymerase sigma-70 factor (TIGR02957 family)